MRRALLDLLCCPVCGSALHAEPAGPAPLTDGSLTCALGHSYPVSAGVPRFVPADGYARSFGLQWNRFRLEQLDSHNGTGLSERRFRSETGWDPEALRGKQILEVGCGSGRFLEVASRWAGLVVGVDASSAVDAAAVSLGARENVELIQASVYALPFRDGSFDGVYCIGVVQHTPEPARTLSNLAPPIRRGGRLAVTSYERRPWTKLHTKYLIRPLTSRMAGPRLLRMLELIMPVLFVLTDVLYRLPVLGMFFRFAIPVANYVEVSELTRSQRYRWALLDTFDMLSPAYDQPQTFGDVQRVLAAAGITGINRLKSAGLNVVGVKGA